MKEQAHIDARRTVANCYAVKQKSNIAWWSVTVSVAEVNIEEHSESEPINNSTFITKDNFTQVDGGSDWSVSRTYKSPNTLSVTLVNDSPIDVPVYNYTIGDGYNSVDAYEVYYMTLARREWLQIDGNFSRGFHGWETAAPNSNYDSMTFIEHQSFVNHRARYGTKNDDFQAEVSNFANVTHDDFVAGNTSSSDVISANTATFGYDIQSGSDSASLYNLTAALALMGFDVPDMQPSGLMNAADQSGTANVTCQDLVLARSASNGLRPASTICNASAIDDPVFIATVTGEKIDLDGTLTIIEMVAHDRSSVQSQNTTQYVYKTTNTSKFVSMTDKLESLCQDIEEREQSSGGSGDSGDLDSQALGIALLVGAAAVLLIQREDNE